MTLQNISARSVGSTDARRPVAILASTLTICLVVVAFAASPEQTAGTVLVGLVALFIGFQGIQTDCGWNAAVRTGGRTGHDHYTLAVHCLGLVLGAVTTASLLFLVGKVVHAPAVVAMVAFVLLGLVRLGRPGTVMPGGWKVRRSWERFGTRPYLFLFGYFLGLGFVTTMASPLALAIAAWALTGSAYVAVTGVLLCFALGRILTTAAATWMDPGDRELESANVVRARTPRLVIIEGALAIAAGVVLFVA